MVCKSLRISKPARTLHGSSTKITRMLHGRQYEICTKGARFVARIPRVRAVSMARKPTVPGIAVTIVELMAENARAVGRGRRSKLFLWLRAHHDQLVEGFDENGPSWITIAAQLGSYGLVDGAGKPPAPETVRATWYRVRREVATSRANGAKAVVSDLPAGVVIPMIATAPVPRGSDALEFDTDTPETEPQSEPEFKFAALRGTAPPEVLRDAREPPIVDQRHDPDQATARLPVRSRPGMVPMPDVPEPEEE